MSFWNSNPIGRFVSGVPRAAGNAVTGNWSGAADALEDSVNPFGWGGPENPGTFQYGPTSGTKWDPANPYNSAANSIDGVAGMAGDFSNTQWQRQMGGLQGALGQMQPSQDYWNQAYGGNAPGDMEQAFSQMGGQFFGSNQSQGTANDFRNYMQQSPLSYQAANNANAMAGGKVDYSGLSSQMQGPGNASQFYAQNQGQYGNAGAGESWFAQNGKNFNNAPESMNVYQQFGSQLYGPGRAESFNPQNVNAGGAYGGQLDSRFSGGSNVDQGAREIGGYARSADDVTNYAASQMGSLQGPGVYEQFVQSDIMGNNPAHEMAMKEGLGAVNQEMARRGHFKSGGAGAAIGKFVGNMEAADYQNRANRAQAAQGMQLSRIGAGQGLSQASAQGKLAQGGALQNLSNSQDNAKLGIEGLRLNAAQLASQEGLANQRLGLDAATASDQSRNARLNTLSGMAQTGDQQWLAQQQAAGNLANQSQQSQLQRLQGGMNASNMVDQNNMQQVMNQFQMANTGNNQDLQRAQFQFQMGQGMDAANLARYGMMGQLGNQADQNQMNQLVNYMNAANQSQQSQQGRLQNAMSARQGIDQTMAQLYGGFYGQGGQLSGQSFSDMMNAMANSAQLRSQGQAAGQQQLFDWASLGVKAYGAKK